MLCRLKSSGNVLYVQDSNFTLILVAKLLKQTNCLALFSDTICVFHDCFSRTLIQAGEERDGVYYFTDIVLAKSDRAVGGSDHTLWHQRLGHLSFLVLSDCLLFLLNLLALILLTLLLDIIKLVRFVL